MKPLTWNELYLLTVMLRDPEQNYFEMSRNFGSRSLYVYRVHGHKGPRKASWRKYTDVRKGTFDKYMALGLLVDSDYRRQGRWGKEDSGDRRYTVNIEAAKAIVDPWVEAGRPQRPAAYYNKVS